MTCTVEVMCWNDDCTAHFEYECEWESAENNSDHEAKCPECGKVNMFSIEYDPYASTHGLKED